MCGIVEARGEVLKDWDEWKWATACRCPAFKATRYVCSELIRSRSRSRCIIGRVDHRQTPHPHPCRPGASQDPCPFPSLKFGCAQAFYASLRDSAIRPAFSSFDFFTKKGYIVAGSPHGFNWRGNITRRELDESASSTACALCFQSPPFPFFETRPATVASARRDGLETGQQVARREASRL
jgi:hypothetical protein